MTIPNLVVNEFYCYSVFVDFYKCLASGDVVGNVPNYAVMIAPTHLGEGKQHIVDNVCKVLSQ